MAIIQARLRKGNRYNDPKLIVVHAMGEFIKDPDPTHAVQFLKNYGLSAHVLAASDGDIYICRDPSQGAYHARKFNTNSLGIEFLVAGEHNYASFVSTIAEPDWVSPMQWESGIEVVRGWMQNYNITEVVKHSDLSPGRKVDPGAGFPWDKFQKRIHANEP